MTYTAHLFLGNGLKQEITGTNKRKLEAEARRILKKEGFPPREDSWKKRDSWGLPVCRYSIEDENGEDVTSERSIGLVKTRYGARVWIVAL